MAGLIVFFPTKARPAKFFTVFRKYHNLKRDNNTRFIVTIDTSDPTMYNKNVIDTIQLFGDTTLQFNETPGKIAACNYGVKDHVKDGDVILLASDDMIPQIEGYDTSILNDFAKWFPEGDGVLHYYDGHTRLNTMCCLDKKYFDRFGYLYHPAYKSLFCDNEFMDVASMLNRQVFIRETIIRHEHYSNGHGRPDRLMMYNEKFYKQDMETFNRRKDEGFPE